MLQHSEWNKGLWNVHSLMTILSITPMILQLGADNINSSIAIMKIKWNKGLWNVHSLMTILSITLLILQLGADNINNSIAIMKITLLYLRCCTRFDW